MSIPSLDDFNKRAREKKGDPKKPKKLNRNTLSFGKEAPEGYRKNGFGVTLPSGVQDFNQGLRNVPGGQLPSLTPPQGVDWRLFQNTAKEGVKRLRGGVAPATSNDPSGGADTGAGSTAKTLADYLQEAMNLIGGSGGGVNYDPQRATARQNASEADARLEAMYRQLRGSIDADAPVLQQAYQTAIDSTAQNAATAQAQTQAAADNAQARNDQVLANLGIQQAAGNQIQEGRDLGTQTAGNIAAQASKGQAAGDRLVSNQATALQHNTNIGNAAGLEGNLQRAANQAKLNALLSEIDMKEQQDNAATASDGFSKQLSMANSLLDFDRYNQEQQASQDQALAKLMNDRDIAAMKAQSNQAPDLRAMLKMMGVDETWLTKDPKAAASLIGALTKTTFAQ